MSSMKSKLRLAGAFAALATLALAASCHREFTRGDARDAVHTDRKYEQHSANEGNSHVQ